MKSNVILFVFYFLFTCSFSFASIHIEAEDCNLSGLAYDMNDGTVSIAHNGQQDGHYSANGVGTVVLPVAIPDGTYTVKIAWSLQSWSHWKGQVGIQNLGSGTLIKNGVGITGDGGEAGYHYFHTRTDPCNYITGDYNMVDYLASTNGMEFENPDYGDTIADYITVSDIQAGDLAISFSEPSTSGYDNFRIDWIELIPIQVLHIEAEDCNLSGLAYDMNDGTVSIAHNGQQDGHYSASGVGTMAFPINIPDGEYFLKVKWSLQSWSHWRGQVAIENLGSGSVVENDVGITGDGGEAGFHYFHTRTDPCNYITGNYDMEDYLAGPGGMEFENPDYNNTICSFITVQGVGPNELAVSFSEPSTSGYDNFRIDWFELIPVHNEYICVYDISSSVIHDSNAWKSEFTVTVKDQSDDVVSSALVVAEFEGVHAYKGSVSQLTDANGQATFTTDYFNGNGDTKLTVLDMNKDSCYYNVYESNEVSCIANGTSDLVFTIEAEDCTWSDSYEDATTYVKIDGTQSGTGYATCTIPAANIPAGFYTVYCRMSRISGMNYFEYVDNSERGSGIERQAFICDGNNAGSITDANWTDSQWYEIELFGDNEYFGVSGKSGAGLVVFEPNHGNYVIKFDDNDSRSYNQIGIDSFKFVAGTFNPMWELKQVQEDFSLGMYINWNIPPHKALHDLGRHGVSFLKCNYVISEWPGSKWLNESCVPWGIKTIDNFAAGTDCNETEAQMRTRIQNTLTSNLKYSNKGDRNEDTLIGWYTADEIEARTTAIGDHVALFNNVLQQEDPNRYVITNHSYANKTTTTSWWDVNDTWCWSTMAYTIDAYDDVNDIYYGNTHRVGDAKKLANNLNYENYIIVSQAHVPVGDIFEDDYNNLSYYEFSPVAQSTLDYLNSRTEKQDIKSLLQVAYDEEAEGIAFYKYDHDNPVYTFVDEYGQDVNDKWDGVYEAIREIRADQGWPECYITSLSDLSVQRGSISVDVNTVNHGGSVNKVIFDYSMNDGRSYKYLGKDTSSPWSITFDVNSLVDENVGGRPPVILRARAWDGDHWSIPDAVKIYTTSAIKVEAEDCNLSGLAYDMGSDVSIAHNGSADGHIYASGVGTLALPIEIPDGTYYLRVIWSLQSWGHWKGGVAIKNLGSGTVTENSVGVTGDGGFGTGYHYFHTKSGGSSITGNYLMSDYLAGPGGMEFENPDYGNTMAISLTVADLAVGDLAISFDDPATGTYDNFRIDYFELIPVD